jgi:hypothetical protein
MIVKVVVSHVLALERIARSLKNEASCYFFGLRGRLLCLLSPGAP